MVTQLLPNLYRVDLAERVFVVTRLTRTGWEVRDLHLGYLGMLERRAGKWSNPTIAPTTDLSIAVHTLNAQYQQAHPVVAE